MGATTSQPVYAEDKCPVDHKNMSEAEKERMLAQYKAMSGKHPGRPSSSPSPPSGDVMGPSDAATSPDRSVSNSELTSQQLAASHGYQKAPPPVPAKPATETVYDVYGQELSKSNMMPSTPNQLPAPGQKEPLSTHRVKSSIPKSGDDATWTYPSPQMFFNALKRKGKADGVQEEDMDTVVSVHNNMNECTWAEVMQWERRFHCDKCENPKLKRFLGRPHDLSPAARFRVWFRGYPMPFDRHDWVVDRCGEEEARYVIDYYYREGPDPIEIHVRPALDSTTAAFDRLRNGAMTLRDTVLGDDSARAPSQQQTLEAAITAQADSVVKGTQLDKDEFHFLSNLSAERISAIADDVQKDCTKASEALAAAGGDAERMERANIALNYCMARRICPPQAANFMKALEGTGDEGEAYAGMTGCLDRFHIVARRAMMEAAGVQPSGPEFPAGNQQAPASRVE